MSPQTGWVGQIRSSFLHRRRRRQGICSPAILHVQAATTLVLAHPAPDPSLHEYCTSMACSTAANHPSSRSPSLAWPKLTNNALVVNSENTLNYAHLRTTACAYAPSDVVELGTAKIWHAFWRAANLRFRPGTRRWTTPRRT